MIIYTDSVESLLSFATISISIDQFLTPRRKFWSGEVTKTKFLVRNLRGRSIVRNGVDFQKNTALLSMRSDSEAKKM